VQLPWAADQPAPWAQGASHQQSYQQSYQQPQGQPWAGPGPASNPYATTAYGQDPARPSTGRWRRAVVATAAGAALAVTAGGVGGFVGYAMHPDGAGSPLQTIGDTGGGQPAAPVVDRSSLSTIAASIQPTVVVISTGSGEGSGVVVSGDGYIVTNNHVVEGARGSVDVTFNSGRKVRASIVGTDPKTDLAVVKADATGLTFATWGDSDAVKVGDTVLAIGSPLGLQGSVTAGIVSALHRTITVGGNQQSPFDTGDGRTTLGDAIQTDAPINPGNSGGALVNLNGQVIGINTAIATSGTNGNIGVGFAISANRARSVADQLIKGEKVSHPYLGVRIADAESGGAEIAQVEPGGPAAEAGLREGDVVTKVGDRPVSGSETLVGAIQSSSVGSELTLTVIRGGSEQTITVTVGEAP
jgi:putative serine protease PepD